MKRSRLLLFCAACAMAFLGASFAASNGHQPAPGPNVGPHTPFGSVAFDPLPAMPDPNVYPIWNPIPCSQDISPQLLYADDPETWTTDPIHSWGTKHNLLLEMGGYTNQGLIDYYFDNQLGQTARLYVGAIGEQAATTFQYAVGANATPDSGNFSVLGAQATQAFLPFYVNGTGFHSGSAPAPAVGQKPKQFFKVTIPDKTVVTGEIEVKNLSANTTFFVYADDCTGSPCPGINHIAPDDGNFRRGLFLDAHFTISHNFTGSISNSSGGISWVDIGGSLPGSATCVIPITGNDPINHGDSRTLQGDYGVPILFQGTPWMQFEQFWYMNPRGNVPFSSALWVGGFTDPNTTNPVPNGAYFLPTTFPGAPTQPTAVPDTTHAITVGLDGATDNRAIIYIPSGGDSWPVRFYYIVPAGLARSHAAHQER